MSENYRRKIEKNKEEKMLKKTKKAPKKNSILIKKVSIWFMICLILYVVLYGMIPHTVYAAQ